MKEITRSFADQFVREIACPVPDEFHSILGENEDLKKILPIIAEQFINRLRFKNPADFVHGIVHEKSFSRRDLNYY
jgi:hypothetical protein